VLAWAIIGALVTIGAMGTVAIAGPYLGDRISIGEADEAAHAGDAKVTPEQAKGIAQTHTDGTAISVELNNEDGYLVYIVLVKGADGTVSDVKVDAGTGQVLGVEPDDGNESSGDDD
jgi:uncharacterized membrane protein YkoI